MSSNDNMIKGRVTVGDWSGDGHEKTDVIDILVPHGLKAEGKDWDQSGYIKGTSQQTWGCSKDPNLWFYYELAVSKGVPNLKKLYCSDYEECTMPKAGYDELLSSLGLDPTAEEWQLDSEDDSSDDGEPVVYLDSEIFAELWIAIVNYGIKLNGEVGEVKSYTVAREKVVNFNIGGYGLTGY